MISIYEYSTLFLQLIFSPYQALSGEGWTLRHFYISGDLQQYIPYGDRVEIVTIERFIMKANTGKL